MIAELGIFTLAVQAFENVHHNYTVDRGFVRCVIVSATNEIVLEDVIFTSDSEEAVMQQLKNTVTERYPDSVQRN